MSRSQLPRSVAQAPSKLVAILQDSVEILNDAELLGPGGGRPAGPEQSLVQKRVELAVTGANGEDEPIRTWHHIARTGGTVIS